MKVYLVKTMLFHQKDVAIIVGMKSDILELYVDYLDLIDLAGCECEILNGNVIPKIFVDGDFNTYNQIDVQLSSLNNGIDPICLDDNSGWFEVDVTMQENEDPIYEVKDRNFKLEHLSMELQKRIHDKAEEMYQDWIKVKQD